MVASATSQIKPSAPSFVKGISRSIDHAWKLFDAVQLPEFGVWEGLLDRRAEAFIVDRHREPTSQPRRQMLETHHLKAVLAIVSGAQPSFAHGQSAMSDHGLAVGCHEDRHRVI